MSVLVKICGLTRREDAEAALAAGASFAGVVLAPGGRRSVTPAAAARLLSGLPLRRVGVFVDEPEAGLLSAAEAAELDVLQLHGDEPPALLSRLRDAGRWTLWKALRPRNATELLEALARYGTLVDGILLDGYSPEARGGTGTPFPWEELAPHRHRVPAGVQLVVAGGLHPRNVARAVSVLRPDVVDVSSGVELAAGRKDASAVHSFVRAARAAVAPLNG